MAWNTILITKIILRPNLTPKMGADPQKFEKNGSFWPIFQSWNQFFKPKARLHTVSKPKKSVN